MPAKHRMGRIYVWSFPGAPIKVHLRLDVVERLAARLQYPAGERGVLLGRPRANITEIDDFEPDIPDHAVPEIVGCYRVQDEEFLRLNPSDYELADSLISGSHCVFLVIRRPTASEPANATFFFRDHSGMAGEFPFLEFPFVPELLAPKGVVLPIKPEPLRAEPVPEPPAEVEEPHEPRRTFAPEPGEPASPGRKGKLKPVLFALPVVLLGLASYPAFHLLPRGRVATPAPPPIAVPEPPAAATGLGLFAERQNSDLKLTWNRDSPMVKAAASGVLSIRDGSSQRDLALDGAQVRGGSLLYSPVSSQVQLQLAITGPGGHAAESVIAILPKHIPDGAAEPRRAASAAAPASLKPFVAPQRRPEAFDAPPSFGPPPIGKPALVPAGLTASFLNPELHPPAPVPATPTARKETAARPPVRVAAWRPPALIRESAPAIPPALRPLLGSQKSVEVRVDLDAAGRVLSAQSVREPYLHKLLADSAEAAARRCTFEPAHNGDKAVPSEIILRFQFKAQP